MSEQDHEHQEKCGRQRRKKNKGKIYKRITNIVGSNTTTSIVTVKVSGLNIPIERQRLST